MIVIAQTCSVNEGVFPLALFISVAACTGFGVLNGLGTVLLKIPPLIMTLSMGSVVIGVTLIYTKGFPTGMAPGFLKKLVLGNSLLLPNMVLIWFLIAAGVIFIMSKTKAGRIMYGVGANRLTAEFSGVDTLKVRISAYGISGFVCGFAGMFLLGYMSAPNNLETGTGYVMPSIAAAVVGGVSLSGGKGNYGGAMTGVIFLTVLEALLMTVQLGEPVRKIVYGGVVIGILISYVLRSGRSR
jgi:ribose transport system permease protein